MDIISKSTRSFAWTLVPVIFFAIAYTCALELKHVEGDDASMVQYHAMGRNPAFQSTYADYHLFSDVILSILPGNEQTVRIGAMLISALSTVGVTILALQIAFDWLAIHAASQKSLLSVLAILACPELLYLGLVYTPTMLAMFLILLAHKIAHQINFGQSRRKVYLKLFVSSALFSFGAACRWDTATYGAVLATDIVVWSTWRAAKKQPLSRSVAISALWSIAALLGWFVILSMFGYPPSRVLDRSTWGANLIPALSVETFLRLQPMITPLASISLLVGIFYFLRRNPSLLAVAAVSLITVLPWFTFGVPKLMIGFLPVLLAAVVATGQIIAEVHSKAVRCMLQLGVWLIAFLPWMVGVQVQYDDHAWGPLFDIKPYNRPISSENTVRLVLLGEGSAIPTSEGPRPLFGHFAVIFGQRWRDFVKTQDAEISAAVAIAQANSLPIYVIDRNVAFHVAKLLELGFTTDDASGNTRRAFTNDRGDVVVIRQWDSVKQGIIGASVGEANLRRVVVFAYPSTIRAWYLKMPTAFEPVMTGRETAIFNIQPKPKN